MKKILLIMMFLLPLTMMAHEGHGISGDKVIHLLVSHNISFILLAFGAIAIIYYRLRIRAKK